MINKKIYFSFKNLYNKVSKKTILDTLSLTGVEYNILVEKYNTETASADTNRLVATAT